MFLKIKKHYKYNYVKIFRDILFFKIKMNKIKDMKKTFRVLYNVTNLKPVKFKEFLLLNERNLIKAHEIHNKYVIGEKINVSDTFLVLRGRAQEISRIYSDLTSRSITGIFMKIGSPQFILVNTILNNLFKIGIRDYDN